MDQKQEDQLLRWHDEVETMDEGSEFDAESRHDPFSTDDSIEDPEYTQSVLNGAWSHIIDAGETAHQIFVVITLSAHIIVLFTFLITYHQMALLGNLMRKADNFFSEEEDPLLAKWPMMSNPLNTILISLFHVYFVKVLGPALMKDRKPFEFNRILLVYNFSQVIFSTWIFYGFASSGWLTGEYSFRCQPKDTSNSPHSIAMARATYWYYISKLTDLLDTVFFVLRKKSKQISLLHVLHHGLMPFGCWIVAKYSPSGQVTFVGLLNSFVHIVMYSYYGLSALGPAVRKYLWWKKYITALQITQFVAIIIHTSQPLFFDCDFSKIISAWIALETCLFLFLFGNFYREEYKKKSDLSKVKNGTCDQTENKEKVY